MLTYSAHLQSVIEKLIKDEIDMRTKNLVSAHQSLDYAAYKHQVGIIVGLERALQLISAAATAVNRPSPFRRMEHQYSWCGLPHLGRYTDQGPRERP